MGYPDKYVNTQNEMPTGVHWAIVKYSSVHIPGDQRSIDCPGHGYPAHTKSVVKYEVYLTKKKWLEEIGCLESRDSREKYSALEVHPVKINRTVSVEVST